MAHRSIRNERRRAVHPGADPSSPGGCAMAAQTAAISCNCIASWPYVRITLHARLRNALVKCVRGVLAVGTDGLSVAKAGSICVV
jgi:hypothetical protein